MRHVLIKHAHNTGEVMVALVVRNYPFHNSDSLIKDVLVKYPQIKSLVAIVNKREDNVILDGEEILLAGKHYIEEELLGCTFRISARSFYQINPYATRELYSKAIELAGLTGNETLIDLYCGTGTMGIIAAKQAKQVYGIEIVADAIRDANTNAENNNVTNIKCRRIRRCTTNYQIKDTSRRNDYRSTTQRMLKRYNRRYRNHCTKTFSLCIL